MQHSIWHMYSAIRNGLAANRKSIIHPKNLLCLEVLTVLYKEGFISGFRNNPDDTKTLEIFLKYNNRKPALTKILPVSRPGRRIYVSAKTLWKLETSFLTLILSTPQGVLSDKQCRKFHQGGEILCLVS